MITTFDIALPGKKLLIDPDSAERISEYTTYRNLYENDFASAFPSTFSKIIKKYPFENTTAQTLIELNLFWAVTDFFKTLLTNGGLHVSTDNSQEVWDEIQENNNFLAVLKEVFIDNSRFGNGIFKVAAAENGVRIFSICPDCWFPVFNKGNLNCIEGHILVYPMFDTINGKQLQLTRIEKHRIGYVENELWLMSEDMFKEKLDIETEISIPEVDDFSNIWNDFVIFPVKNSTESDKYFGDSDYKRCKSVVEELMLTVSQNSKIINRHANPKMTGSTDSLEFNPVTGRAEFPNKDYIPVGRDGVKAEYITVDLQAAAIKQHIDTLLQFFYILTKTPPQAYGIDVAGNLSGESLKKIFMSTLAKLDDMKQVSFDNSIKQVVKCAMAFSNKTVNSVNLNWGDPLPEDYAQLAQINNERVTAGTQTRAGAIMEIDKVDENTALLKAEQIAAEKDAKVTDQI